MQIRQSRFFEAQDAKNEFAWPFDNLKFRYIDFTKVFFLDVQKAVYESTGPIANLNIT
jgi:hypothetical protein